MFVQSWEVNTPQFSAQRLYELPPAGSPQLFYYPGPTTTGGHDGPIIQINPHGGNKWIAMFADSELGAPLCGLYPWPPDERMFCVIANGGGYVVDSHDPKRWAELKPLPIRGIFYFEDINTLVCYTFTDFIAWNGSGEAWQTNGLSLDGIGVKSIQGHVLTGWYNDITLNGTLTEHPFKIDAENGKFLEG